MWYAVETAFIDGQLFESRCCFIDGDTSSPVGHCFAGSEQEPQNSCQKFYNDRIEVRVDWFESESIAHDFCDGKITYIHHYEAYFDKSILTTRRRYIKREIVPVDHVKYFAHKGVDIEHKVKYRPWWVY